MENEDVIDEKQESSKKKPNAFIRGFSKMGKFISDKYKSAMDTREAKKQAKELEENIKNEFLKREDCQTFDCVSKDKKTFSIVGDMNYSEMKLTIYGEDERIQKGCVFIDRTGQVFKIDLIKLNQNVEIVLNDETYKRSAMVIELSLEKDETKKQEVQTYISSTNINITDSTIKSSDIGGRKQ